MRVEDARAGIAAMAQAARNLVAAARGAVRQVAADGRHASRFERGAVEAAPPHVDGLARPRRSDGRGVQVAGECRIDGRFDDRQIVSG